MMAGEDPEIREVSKRVMDRIKNEAERRGVKMDSAAVARDVAEHAREYEKSKPYKPPKPKQSTEERLAEAKERLKKDIKTIEVKGRIEPPRKKWV